MGEVLTVLRRLFDAAVVFRSILDEITGTPSESRKFLQAPAPLADYKAAALAGLADVRVLQGRFLDAANIVKLILDLRPNDLRLRLQRGICLRSAIASHRQIQRIKDVGTAGLLFSLNEQSPPLGFNESQAWQELEIELASALHADDDGDIDPLKAHGHRSRQSLTCVYEAPDLFLPACLALGEAREELGRPMQALISYELAVQFHNRWAARASHDTKIVVHRSKSMQSRLRMMSNDDLGTPNSLEGCHQSGSSIKTLMNPATAAESLYRLGRLHLSMEHFDVAAKCFGDAYDSVNLDEGALASTSASDLHPGPMTRVLEIQQLRSKALMKLGASFASADDNGNAALCHLKLAAELDPTAPQPPHQIGIVLLGMCDDAEGAAAAHRAALKLDPNLASAHSALATCLGAMGNLEGAVRSYEAGITLMVRDGRAISPDALAGLGDTLSASRCCRD
jgi:Flp pilus assembly protein TadD